MGRQAIRGATIVAALLLGGCAAQTFQFDQEHIRASLLDLYEQQIMDNLVRIRLRLPIVHIDYETLTGTVKSSAGATGGRGGKDAKGVGTELTFSLGASASQDNTVQVLAKPVTENHEVYLAYLVFAADEFKFRQGAQPPAADSAPDDQVHGAFIRKVGDEYFWVPRAAASEFLKLALTTTVLRGKPVSDPTTFTVTVKRTKAQPEDPIVPGQRRITLEFMPAIPNGIGTILVDLPTIGETEFDLQSVSGIGYGDDTTKLTLFYSVDDGRSGHDVTADVVQAALLNKDATVRLAHFTPDRDTVPALLKELGVTLELFRSQNTN